MESATKRRRTQRERVAESTRRLAVAAVELFGEQGYERTTAAQIGERAGYSREMVRRRYGSKEALLEAVFETRLRPRIVPDPDPSLSGLDQVLGQVDFLVELAENDQALARAFFVLAFETAGPIATERTGFREWFAGYESQITKTLRAGQADGSIREDLDCGLEAKLFVSHTLGLAYRWTLDWDRFDFVVEARSWRASLARHLATD